MSDDTFTTIAVRPSTKTRAKRLLQRANKNSRPTWAMYELMEEMLRVYERQLDGKLIDIDEHTKSRKDLSEVES